MVDHFEGDFAGLRRIEGPALGGIQCCPLRFVDLGVVLDEFEFSYHWLELQ
jgi:hypothetical protein